MITAYDVAALAFEYEHMNKAAMALGMSGKVLSRAMKKCGVVRWPSFLWSRS